MRSMFVAAALVVAAGLGSWTASPANAWDRSCVECQDYEYGNPQLFYNFYAPPNCGGIGATLYTAPGPVPAHVGQTYFTYQPLMPHEFLYKHKRVYHRYYNGGRGLTRTSVRWR